MSAEKEYLDFQQFNIIYFVSLLSEVKCKIFSCSFRRSATQEMEILFSVEFGKIKPTFSGDPGGEFYEPKWPHYRSLLFLKVTMKPPASSSNLKWDKSVPV
jgi:hypothetical protein